MNLAAVLVSQYVVICYISRITTHVPRTLTSQHNSRRFVTCYRTSYNGFRTNHKYNSSHEFYNVCL